MRHVYRSVIPANGAWHVLYLHGPIVHVATRAEDHVEVWHLDDPAAAEQPRMLCVVGTGHPIDDGLAHLGTAVTPSGRFVWHLFEGPVA